jgi:hypothetical protein
LIGKKVKNIVSLKALENQRNQTSLAACGLILVKSRSPIRKVLLVPSVIEDRRVALPK